MRVMNGRLHNLHSSAASVDSNGGGEDGANNPQRHSHKKHHHKHHQKKRKNRGGAAADGGEMNDAKAGLRRRSSDEPPLPRSVQFDESSDAYRCLCGCFHVKIGAMCIAGIELFLILCYFLNALTVLLQQKQAYGNGRAAKTVEPTSADYVPIAFIITSASLAVALSAVLLMIVGLTRNIASLLIPHLITQAVSIFLFTGLLLMGTIALVTDHAYFYRFLNAAPFNDYPGQATVALEAETMVRIYAVLALYGVSLALECWFIVIIYNCNRYFTERRTYMNYCLAYSTPMKTLNSARYS